MKLAEKVIGMFESGDELEKINSAIADNLKRQKMLDAETAKISQAIFDLRKKTDKKNDGYTELSKTKYPNEHKKEADLMAKRDKLVDETRKTIAVDTQLEKQKKKLKKASGEKSINYKNKSVAKKLILAKLPKGTNIEFDDYDMNDYPLFINPDDEEAEYWVDDEGKVHGV
jgi:chromosome segregation ATPase